MLVVFTVYMVGVALLTLAERKISAWIQDRTARTASATGTGCSRPPTALKNFMKEETYPAAAYTPLFILAPMLSLHPALHHLGGDSVRGAAAARAGGSIEMVGRRPAGRLPLHPRDLVARRVRHRARRLVVEQQVLVARRTALERADDVVRDRDGHVDDPVLLLAGNVSLQRDRDSSRRSDVERLHRSSIAFFIFLSPRSPRRTACRSICRRRSRS